MADFQNCHIWLWNLAIGQNSRSGTYIYRYSLSNPGAQKWDHSHSASSGFRDTGRFSKFSYLGMNSEVTHILSFYPKGWKLSLFSLYGQRFPRYIFKIAIFGHETWQVAKLPEVAHIVSFYPIRVTIELIFALRGSGLRDTGQCSNLPYLDMKLGKWPKFQKLHIYPLSTPGGQNWAYFCSTGSVFWDMGQFSKLPYLGMTLVTFKGLCQGQSDFGSLCLIR